MRSVKWPAPMSVTFSSPSWSAPGNCGSQIHWKILAQQAPNLLQYLSQHISSREVQSFAFEFSIRNDSPPGNQTGAPACWPHCGHRHRYCLGSSPEFDALSYFWGPPQFDTDIVVNGAALAITSNLADSLRRYRQQSTKRRGLLWVDAVCINQRDKLELNKQLLLMQRSYRRAQTVYIDLGEVDLAWYQGFDLLHKLSFVYEWVKDSSEQDFSLVSIR